MTNSTDIDFMKLAINAAKNAPTGEVPIGAVIVRDGKVIADGHNLKESTNDPTAHAEIVAIRRAATALGGANLTGCTLYVTLEPCPMCAGALWQAHLDRVVFGAYDAKGGALGSVCNLYAMPFAGTPLLKGGVLADQCGEIITIFFENYIRSAKKSCNFGKSEV